MKKILKSLLAITAAFLMVFTLGTAVNADENGTGSTNFVKINITDDYNTAGDSIYNAYQLMKVTNDNKGHYNYTINNKYSSILQLVAGRTSDAETMKYIENLKSDDDESAGEKLRNFADKVYEAILSSNTDTDTDNDIKPDYKSEQSQKTLQVEPGYYLIAETGATGANNTDSLVMVDTAGSNDNELNISTKEDVPTVEKKVQEINDSDHSKDSGWQDAADYDVNDEICYRLKGTLPDNYSSYTNYKYTFTDTLSKGLNEPHDVKIYIVDDKTLVGDRVETPDTLKGNNYHEITKQFDEISCSNYNIQQGDKNYNSDYKDGKVLTLTCSDLKKITKDDKDKGVNITSNSAIIVLYKTELNTNAEIGAKGNPNEVTLTYTNNPYNAVDGETNTTPKDKVTVYTYQVVVNKTDGTNPLSGADFTLEKLDGSGKSLNPEKKYTPTHPINGDDKESTFIFSDLDAGTYKLVESKVPDGYKAASDLIFKVEATYDPVSDDPKLTSLVVKDNKENVISTIDNKVTDKTFYLDTATNAEGGLIYGGTMTTTVVNTPGSKLPSTGGIGTTMFYVFGGGLVAVAAALLIAKKRASAE